MSLAWNVLRSLFTLGKERILGRRGHPSWNLSMKLASRLFRNNMKRAVKMSFSEQREFYRKLARPNPFPQKVSESWFEIDGLRACWFTPTELQSPGTLLYWHGGGYCICSIDTHKELIARLAKASGCRTLAVDYRLAPEAPFPCAVDDAEKVMNYLWRSGHKPETTVVAGDSAGGNLALVSILKAIANGQPVPAACVGISPWVDLASQRRSHIENSKFDYVGPKFDAGWRQAYVGTEQAKNPFVSPIYGDYKQFPPLLLQAGGAETLRDDIAELAKIAEAAGVDVQYREWEGMIHVWHFLASLVPASKEAIAEVGNFVKAHTSSGSHT